MDISTETATRWIFTCNTQETISIREALRERLTNTAIDPTDRTRCTRLLGQMDNLNLGP